MITFKEFLTEAARYDAQGRVMGNMADWFEMFGANKEDVKAAAEKVRQSDIYKKYIKLGLRDVSLEDKRRFENGTIEFRADWMSGDHFSNYRIVFLAKGRVTAYSGETPYPKRTREPKVIKGKPVETIYKIMTDNMEDQYPKVKKEIEHNGLGKNFTKNNSVEVKKIFDSAQGYIQRALHIIPQKEEGFRGPNVHIDKKEGININWWKSVGGGPLEITDMHPDFEPEENPTKPPTPDYEKFVRDVIEKGIKIGKIDPRIIKQPIKTKYSERNDPNWGSRTVIVELAATPSGLYKVDK